MGGNSNKTLGIMVNHKMNHLRFVVYDIKSLSSVLLHNFLIGVSYEYCTTSSCVYCSIKKLELCFTLSDFEA